VATPWTPCAAARHRDVGLRLRSGCPAASTACARSRRRVAARTTESRRRLAAASQASVAAAAQLPETQAGCSFAWAATGTEPTDQRSSAARASRPVRAEKGRSDKSQRKTLTDRVVPSRRRRGAPTTFRIVRDRAPTPPPSRRHAAESAPVFSRCCRSCLRRRRSGDPPELSSLLHGQAPPDASDAWRRHPLGGLPAIRLRLDSFVLGRTTVSGCASESVDVTVLLDGLARRRIDGGTEDVAQKPMRSVSPVARQQA
jgi:hypothetical protein